MGVGIKYNIAYSIGFLSGIVISYCLNTKYVFHENFALKKIVQFPIVYLIQYLFGISNLYILVEKLGINAKLAAIIIIILTIPLTFILSRLIIRGRYE
jgi:putative flippase GtrA